MTSKRISVIATVAIVIVLAAATAEGQQSNLLGYGHRFGAMYYDHEELPDGRRFSGPGVTYGRISGEPLAFMSIATVSLVTSVEDFDAHGSDMDEMYLYGSGFFGGGWRGRMSESIGVHVGLGPTAQYGPMALGYRGLSLGGGASLGVEFGSGGTAFVVNGVVSYELLELFVAPAGAVDNTAGLVVSAGYLW